MHETARILMNEKVLATLRNYCKMVNIQEKPFFLWFWWWQFFPPVFHLFVNETFSISMLICIHDYGSRNTGNVNFNFVSLPDSLFRFLFVLFIAIFHFKLPVLSAGNKIIALELELEKKIGAPIITRSERIKRGDGFNKISALFSIHQILKTRKWKEKKTVCFIGDAWRRYAGSPFNKDNNKDNDQTHGG